MGGACKVEFSKSSSFEKGMAVQEVGPNSQTKSILVKSVPKLV